MLVNRIYQSWEHLYHILRGWTGWRLTPDQDLAGLPIAVYPVKDTEICEEMVIFVSGDGGWGRMGTSIARRLSRSGIPVVGIDSTRYFWQPRQATDLAYDLARIAGHYQKKWGVKSTFLVGYSYGADVLPMGVSSATAGQWDEIAPEKLILISPGDYVELKFRFEGWLGKETTANKGEAIGPQVRHLIDKRALKVVIFRGAKEKRGLLTEKEVGTVHILPGGHYFAGQYRRLSKAVREELLSK